MRRARINRDWWRAKLLEAPGLAIAGIFIGVSGLMSVTFGFRLGEPSGNALIFAAVALAIEGFADLAMPLFWHRLGFLGRAVLIVFFGLCLAYKLEAANRFAAENLGKRDAAMATDAQAYAAALETVKQLRKTIADNADARAADLIHAEVEGLLRDPRAEGCTGAINGAVTKTVCPKVDALRAELARAKARDQAQTDLTPALTAWKNAAPVALAAQEGTGPIAGLLALVGIQVGGWSQLIAKLIMMLIEGGAIVVPMLIGFAFGEGRRPAAKRDASQEMQMRTPPQPEPATGDTPVSPMSPSGISPQAQRDCDELAAFLGDCSERAPGERVQASKLYAVYFQWKAERGEDAMKVQPFGTVLTKDLAMGKRKISGKNWYLDLRLRHPAQGRKSSKHLRAVAA